MNLKSKSFSDGKFSVIFYVYFCKLSNKIEERKHKSIENRLKKKKLLISNEFHSLPIALAATDDRIIQTKLFESNLVFFFSFRDVLADFSKITFHLLRMYWCQSVVFHSSVVWRKHRHLTHFFSSLCLRLIDFQ